MEAGPWRRQFVHDLLFAIEGAGWHEPEMKDAIGYRWSGPGRLSVLRMAAPAGAGRGEARILMLPGEALPDVAVFLNGHRLSATARRHGAFCVLDFAWGAAAMAGETRAEFWFHAERMMQLPVPGGRMRAVGFRLSTLTVTGAADGPAPAAEALALILGRRFLSERLPVAFGRPAIALRAEGPARMLDLRLEAARLGPTAQPQLLLALQAEAGGLELLLGPPGQAPVALRVAAGGGLALPAALTLRDGLLLARLGATLPEAFSRWLDDAAGAASPEAELLAAWRRDLRHLARAAETALAAALADGADPFGIEAATPFAWPAGG